VSAAHQASSSKKKEQHTEKQKRQSNTHAKWLSTGKEGHKRAEEHAPNGS